MATILVVDDEKGLRKSLAIAMEDWGHHVAEAASAEEAIEHISKEVFDIVLTDLVMDNMTGLELLQQINEISPQTEVMLMSAHGTIPSAVEAMQKGAHAFIVKPFSNEHLKLELDKIIGQVELRKTVKHLKAVLADHYPFEDLVAVSPVMQEVMRQVALVAHWSVPVLIQGESGVGKELVAMAIHHLSPRNEGPFIPVNCGAFPDTLLDSELFGHAKGSFTGAVNHKRGFIEEADGGTLFLDEIGEAPAVFQVRLLRFLDNGLFRRVGETQERKSNVRIIAATNRNLEEDIKEADRFREDLYFRLSVAVVHVPPLRERKEDIVALSQHFLKLYGRKMGKLNAVLHPQVYRLFELYPWPGNVRELENTIEHALIVSKSEEIQVSDLSPSFRKIDPEPRDVFFNTESSLEEIEKQFILHILRKTGGNKKRAAEILDISRTTLITRLKNWGITTDNM